MTLDELKRENEILKDALCLEQDRLSFARYHLQNAQQRIKRLEESLRQIANQDYRGNRSTESQIAFDALKEVK